MRAGKWFISTGFRQDKRGGFWHLLIAAHKRWRLSFVRPSAKPGYRRVYVGPVEIEWSQTKHEGRKS